MEAKMAEFPGFPQQALQFFQEIRENNNKAWFDQHKDDYAHYVQQPAQDFVMALGAKLQEIAGGISFDPSLSGSGSILRIYRDIRFSPDKTPYKTYLAMRFWEGANRKEVYSGLFIWLDSTGAGLHLGQHEFSKEYLSAFRDAVDNPQSGAELQKALSAIQPHARIGGEKFTNVPRGFAQDHPRGDLLKYKGLHANTELIAPAIVTGEGFLPLCVDYFEKLLPLHNWLVNVGHQGSL
jgi:uncharacterized protein (TIGR02453 family)